MFWWRRARARDGHTVSSPAGKTPLRRACWRRRALWCATLPGPVPRQAPTRERPYGSCRGRPVRFHPLRGRRICVARFVASRVVCGRRCPAPFPARRPQGSAPTVCVGSAHKGAPLRFVSGAPTRDAPTVCFGWRPVRFVSDGCPYGLFRMGARTVCFGWVPVRFVSDGCPYGFVPGDGRTGSCRGRPYGFVPEDGRTVPSPAGKTYLRRAVRGVARVGGRRCPAPFPARRPQGSAPTVRVGSAHKGRPYGLFRMGAPYGLFRMGARTVRVGGGRTGLCREMAVRFYPLRGRCLCVERVGGVAREDPHLNLPPRTGEEVGGGRPPAGCVQSSDTQGLSG